MLPTGGRFGANGAPTQTRLSRRSRLPNTLGRRPDSLSLRGAARAPLGVKGRSCAPNATKGDQDDDERHSSSARVRHPSSRSHSRIDYESAAALRRPRGARGEHSHPWPPAADPRAACAEGLRVGGWSTTTSRRAARWPQQRPCAKSRSTIAAHAKCRSSRTFSGRTCTRSKKRMDTKRCLTARRPAPSTRSRRRSESRRRMCINVCR